jgi:hypothetical protein
VGLRWARKGTLLNKISVLAENFSVSAENISMYARRC